MFCVPWPVLAGPAGRRTGSMVEDESPGFEPATTHEGRLHLPLRAAGAGGRVRPVNLVRLANHHVGAMLPLVRRVKHGVVVVVMVAAVAQANVVAGKPAAVGAVRSGAVGGAGGGAVGGGAVGGRPVALRVELACSAGERARGIGYCASHASCQSGMLCSSGGGRGLCANAPTERCSAPKCQCTLTGHRSVSE